MGDSEERVAVESNGLVMNYENSENPTLAEIEISTTATTTDQNRKEDREREKEKETTLCTVFHRLFTQIFIPDDDADDDRKTKTYLLQRIKTSVYQNAPYLREASRNSTKNLLLWTRQGSPLRALLVISVSSDFPFHPIQFNSFQ
ncbi:hypothetical protein BVC80_441g75 [Macleaya cordata]|uniref:Uncharacterized protein n=1 Tax=Macleaya cordata TaxID=56857 RepID=A0A200Q4I5_MACCD|nr:hypothetical protein BVC80_441g75 [Macleaya cordata]